MGVLHGIDHVGAGLLIADPSVWESLKRLLGEAEESRTLRFLIQRSLDEEEERTEAEAVTAE